MDKSTMVKGLGIFILVVMAFSMIAGAFLMADRGSNPDQTTDPNTNLPEPNATVFSYSMSFDANAVKDLSSIRVGAITSVLDKASIDAKVLKVDGVSKVSSQFKKTTPDANDWVYLADVALKKTADAQSVASAIGDLNVFDKNQGFDAMKLITISVPSSIMLHNVDLNIDRNYSFPSTTLSTLAQMSTTAGDELLVSGSIQLQGSAVISLNLIEEQNLTKQKLYEEFLRQMQIDQNKPIDTNASNNDLNTQSVN
ncbi:MAG: hypothetical protein WCW44_06115 [archaeon]|jgi:hypothetical protein